MRYFGWLVALALLFASPVYAAEPFVETSLATQGKIVVGQQVSIDVDVYVPNFFTSPPQFPLLDVPNAIVTLPDEQAQNLVKSVNGEEYSGIRRTYFIIPQIAGEFTLPTASVPLAYAKVPGQSTPATVNLPAVTFVAAQLPPGAEASAFSAARAELSETLDGDPANLKVGDTLVRRVTLFATGTRAMMLPQLSFDVPDGVKLYRQAPTLADNVAGSGRERGSSRTERVTYVMDREGTFALPALTVTWFDTENMQAQRAELKPLVLAVKERPATADAIAPDLPQAKEAPDRLSIRAMLGIGITILAALVLAFLLHRLWPRMRRWVDVRKQARAQSEPTRYRELLAALNSGDAKRAYSALNLWTKAMGFRSPTDWAEASNVRSVQDGLAGLERDLFGPPHPPTQGSARILASAILAWRMKYRRCDRRSVIVTPALPPLNPPFDNWQRPARNNSM
ncbi:BatD family protein [Phyllobacterium pellucidum]|uniref:BatD family protein n=1 Tax=Phyllobacterium pellucidum TaxID=2740464 RepID=UPI001D15493F|nr:BatD family protein [Phyllobacterium sp. T1018]UGY08916.1 BatD family protein [Phyllobacterium sp. T1018]